MNVSISFFQPYLFDKRSQINRDCGMRFYPNLMKVVVLFCLVLLISKNGLSQSPVFVHPINSGLADIADGVERTANGDILVCGQFGGTVDFDFSPTTFNLTSNGQTDIFLARYSSSGNFIWAFNIGSSNLDAAFDVTEDNSGNIIMVGYFRQNVDFDPGVGSTILISNGQSGSDPGWGGDAFVAKYTATGNFLWAFNVGGFYKDEFRTVEVDATDNIYVGGIVNTTGGVIDFDPSVGVYNLGGSPNGLGCVARYTPTGNFNWAFTFGDYGATSVAYDLEVDPNDTTFVITGHTISTNADFDPGPGVASINTNGNSDLYLAKYSLNGNFMWVYNYGGTVPTNFEDYGHNIQIDNLSNIYMAGTFSGSNVDFDPSPAVFNLSSNGSVDLVYGMYNTLGQLVWIKSLGSNSDDRRAMLKLNNNELILTATFKNTCDFDPSPAVSNFVSNGSGDIFYGRYDLLGNYKCGHSIGGSQNDEITEIDIAPNGANLLGVGYYSSNPIDFDPSTAVLSANNSGGFDAFFGEFTFSCSNDTIINYYAAVQSYDSCTNSVVVDNASDFSANDTILMIQMKGAIIDSTNTSSFGNILNYNNAGNYEENIIQSIVGNTITLKNVLVRSYSIPDGKVQIVSIPQFTNYTINTPHTATPWDGNKGGVFAMNVTGTLNMNADIDVSGKGFRGGVPNISNLIPCNQSDYFYPGINNQGGQKGEGVAVISIAKGYGRGRLANGGGGGNSVNTGGGGGSNVGQGGLGGKQWTGCDTNLNIGGVGGMQLVNTVSTNKVFLGGGGGAGHQNDNQTNPGGNGGGIAYLRIGVLTNTLSSIRAEGLDAENCINTPPSGYCSDGNSGGGGGGSIICTIGSNNSFLASVRGGKGADYTSNFYSDPYGPGGGGGGGLFAINSATIPPSILVDNSGGLNGTLNISNWSYGAEPGQAGQVLTGLNLPIASVPFVPFNGVNAGNDTSICIGQTAQLNASGALSYSWSPVTLSNPLIANPTASPSVTTSFIVMGLDSSGCADQDTVQVFVTPAPGILISSTADTICIGDLVTLTATGATTYSWTGGVINGTPFAPPATATYTVTGTDVNGCVGTNSYTIVVLPAPIISVTPSQPVICQGDTVFFTANGASSYSWSPATGLSNSNIANPYSVPSSSISYTVIGANGSCTDLAVVNVTVRPQPSVTSVASKNPICLGEAVSLSATGASTYSWTNGVQNGISFNPTTTTTYSVTGTDANGCTATNNITVIVNPLPILSLLPSEPAVCLGDSILLYASGAQTYLWSPSSTLRTPTADSTWSKPYNDINYTVLGTDANGCRSSATLWVKVVTDFQLELEKSADINCNKIPIQLSVNGGYNYTWSPAQFLNSSSISNPIADINETTVFYVTAELGNCLSTDSITVFYYNNAESGLFAPNAFTPNADGLNDCYHVRTQGNYEFYEFYIYNRWGQPVFESGNWMDCWDGSYKGEPVPVGTYYYYLRARSECGEVFKKGDINVIR